MFNPRTRPHDGNDRMGGGGQRLYKLLPKPRMSPERPYEFSGHPSWPKGAAHCLRPKAEFARASGRGLSRVREFIVVPCGTPILREAFILITRYTLVPGFRTGRGYAKKSYMGEYYPHNNPEDRNCFDLVKRPMFFCGPDPVFGQFGRICAQTTAKVQRQSHQ
jgi:hypothetical protein